MRQEKLTAGVFALAELEPKLRQALLLAPYKYGAGCTDEDAVVLANYEGLAPDFTRSDSAFKDYVTGCLYLQNLIREKIKAHPQWTLLQFFKNYAPAEDNNDPTAYAAAVGKRLGVDYKTYVISNLV
jgi:hypothetical protein